jgi:hypothetical protein
MLDAIVAANSPPGRVGMLLPPPRGKDGAGWPPVDGVEERPKVGS